MPTVSKAARRIGTAALLLFLGACAHHPKKLPPVPPAPPVPTAAEIEAASHAVDACLHARAYAIEDGRHAADTLGPVVASGCLQRLHVLAVLKSRQTSDKAGAWIVYQSTMNTANALGTRAIDDIRARE